MSNSNGFSRPLPRRLFLQAAGLVAASATLAACAGPGRTENAAKRPLTIMGWADGNGTFKQLLDRYTAETGHETKYLEVPADYPEMVAKYLSYMTSEYDGIDVYLLDDFSAGNFATAGWLEDLQPVLGSDEDAYSQNTKALFKMAGHTRLPIGMGAVAYYYRTDVLEEAGFSGPPTTWDEQISMGKILKDRHPEMWPFQPMASKDSGADALAVQLIWQGGGDPTVANDEGTKRALQYAHDLIYKHGIMPASIVGTGVSEMNPLVQKGESMAWYWYEGSDNRYNSPDSGVAGKWDFAPFPAGVGGPAAHLHAWGWSVPKFSPKREQAMEFAKWATSRAQIKDFMVKVEGMPPPIEELLQDPEVREQVSFCDYLSTNAEYLKWRPIDNKSPLEVNNTIGRMLTSVLTEEKSVDEAAQWGHTTLQKLL